MKKLLLSVAVFGSIFAIVACNKTPPLNKPLPIPPEPIVNVAPPPFPVPAPKLTLESLDLRVTDIEKRMAKARAAWAAKAKLTQ